MSDLQPPSDSGDTALGEPGADPGPRALPARRSGGPAPGVKRRRYLRWKRVATISTLVLITGLVVILAGFLGKHTKDEEVGATVALLKDLGKALEAHFERTRELPRRIAALVNPNSPYRGDPVPEDAWRAFIEYRVVDSRAGVWRLRSLGKDGQAGTADDLIWPQGQTWR